MMSLVNQHKAMGFDQYPPKLLWTAGIAIAPSLTSLVNHTIACTQFPADLKCADLKLKEVVNFSNSFEDEVILYKVLGIYKMEF